MSMNNPLTQPGIEPATFWFVAQHLNHWATAVLSGWTVRGSNPGRGEIFRNYPDRTWVPPILLYNGYRVIPGGKMAGSLERGLWLTASSGRPTFGKEPLPLHWRLSGSRGFTQAIFQNYLMSKSLAVWNCFMLDICTVQPSVVSS